MSDEKKKKEKEKENCNQFIFYWIQLKDASNVKRESQNLLDSIWYINFFYILYYTFS